MVKYLASFSCFQKLSLKKYFFSNDFLGPGPRTQQAGATTRYIYVVCIYGELFLCSKGLWCDTSPKYCRYITLIRYKFILRTTETYIYKCRNNASFRIRLLYTSTIFIEVIDTVSVPHRKSGAVPMSSLSGVGQLGLWEVGEGGIIG